MLQIILTPYTGLSAKLFNFHEVLIFYMISQILSFCLVLTVCDLLADRCVDEAINFFFVSEYSVLKNHVMWIINKSNVV